MKGAHTIESSPASRRALAIIRGEHRSLAAVLWSLEPLIERADPGTGPDLELLSMMVDYIEGFPERCHHPKEDEYLFKAVRARTHVADELLETLALEHARGERMIHELRHALALYRVAGETARPQLASLVAAYATFHWEHMRKEEEVILPLAQRVLEEEDWKTIEAAFSGNADPLSPAGAAATGPYGKLLDLITQQAPDPIGFGGEGLERASSRAPSR